MGTTLSKDYNLVLSTHIRGLTTTLTSTLMGPGAFFCPLWVPTCIHINKYMDTEIKLNLKKRQR